MKWQFDVEHDHLTYYHMGLLWVYYGFIMFSDSNHIICVASRFSWSLMMDDVIGSSLESLGSPRAESVRWAQMEPGSDGEKNTLNKDGTFINIHSYPLLHTSLNTYIFMLYYACNKWILLWTTQIFRHMADGTSARFNRASQVGRGPDAADWLGSWGDLRHDLWW